MKPTYVRLKYNSSIGYDITIDGNDYSHTRAIFNDLNAAQEYLYFKAGKLVAKKFDYNFNEIKNVVIETNDLNKVIDIPAFCWAKGNQYTVVN